MRWYSKNKFTKVDFCNLHKFRGYNIKAWYQLYGFAKTTLMRS